jgi:hypothetical protein
MDPAVTEAPSLADQMDSFKESLSAQPAEAPETPPAKEASPETPAATPPVVAAKTTDELDLSGAVEEKKPEAKLPEEDKTTFEHYNKTLGAKNAKEVRLELFKTRKELDKLQAELTTAKATPVKTEAEQVEKAALQKKIEEIQKERDQYSKQLAKADISNSPEFQEKYLNPWRDAQQQALDDISQYKKTTDKGEEVPITWADIKPILQLPLKDAAAHAKLLLGDDYLIALNHRNTILGKQSEYQKALERHEVEAQNMVVERSKQEAAMKQLFDSETNRLKTEYPELYNPDEKNPRESDQVKKGKQLASAALFGMQGLGHEARIKAAAIVSERAAMFPALAIRLSEVRSENARLTKELEALKNGLPGGGSGSSNSSRVADDSTEAQLERFKATLQPRM